MATSGKNVLIHRRIVRGKPCWCVEWREGGKRHRRFFATKDAAKSEQDRLSEQFGASGRVWLDLTSTQRQEALLVIARCRDAGITLGDLRKAWEGRPVGAEQSRTLGDVIRECIDSKRSAGRRPAYLRSLSTHLNQFARGREATPISAIKVQDVEAWIKSDNLWSRSTKLNRVSTLFAMAVRRRYVQVNPCDQVERVTVEGKPPRILTPEEARKVMDWCVTQRPDAIAWFALAMFGGLRPSECDQVEWGSLNLELATVTVDAAASKVRRRRIVELQPAAVAWLRLAKEATRLRKVIGRDVTGARMPVPHITCGWRRQPRMDQTRPDRLSSPFPRTEV